MKTSYIAVPFPRPLIKSRQSLKDLLVLSSEQLRELASAWSPHRRSLYPRPAAVGGWSGLSERRRFARVEVRAH